MMLRQDGLPTQESGKQATAAGGIDQPAVLPASFAQQRMWFLERFEGGALYNVPVANWLRGSLNVDALRRALSALVERHESLRTVFELRDGVPHQVINPPMPVSLKVIDLTGADGTKRRVLELASQEAREPFDLSVGPLMRAALIKAGEEEHLLVLTLHHSITDAWSMGVLSRELSKLYGAFAAEAPVELPELAIQYGDYAVWQQEWMRSGGLDRQREYWKEQLAGAPPLLELPTDKPRPSRQTFRGATERTTLPFEPAQRLRALGEREGATVFMTLLAAFAALLSRYSGQQEIVIGTPVANRSRVELENVIGLFVNTLPLRIDLEGDPSFATLVRRVREVTLSGLSHQDLPFDKLVEELNPERTLSHAPVTQVLLVVQKAAETSVGLSGLTHERVLADRGTAKFDLSLFVTETPDGLRLSLEYATDLFEQATALRMLEHYRVLLEAAATDTARPVSRLEMLSEAERRLILGAWNDTASGSSMNVALETRAEIPLRRWDSGAQARSNNPGRSTRAYPTQAGRPVHELVADQARRTPHTPAVVSATERLSYAELDTRANRLACHLRDLGVAPGVVVAICAERSMEMVAAVLAVMKAGGAYAPIDPSYPDERIAFMLNDTGATVLLTQQHLLANLPGHSARVVCIDANRDMILSNDGGPVAGEATLDDLAYVIYTSGSTGQPKGVAMSHRPLANLLAWQLESWSGPARTLQFASLSFDVAFQELFSTWCSGGTLVLVDESVRRDPGALLALLREQEVQRLFLPFVALESLCRAAEHLDDSVESLREVITAGEQLRVTDAVRRFFARHPRCALVNQYGPTESHVVSAFELEGPPERWPELPPIGRPISNAKLYLLDRHRQPVPVGVPGELYIGGVSLARGYLGRLELTAERFVADPFGEKAEARNEEAEARMYRTGDRARHLPDGNLEYLGRTDHQMKIRGFRVEPGEIEAALREHPAVQDALVLARQDEQGDKRLVVYLTGDQDSIKPEELRDHLRRMLPDYMIPSAFVSLDAFPLSPNGKVDRARLASIPLDRRDGEHELTAPRTDTERRLAAIWLRVLDIEQVGVYDDFFALGGHSLLAVRLFSEIERKLGARLPLAALFQTATIAGLAELIDGQAPADQAKQWPSIVPMRPGRDRRPLFLVGWVEGEVLGYRDLVERLGGEMPIIGLQPPGVDGERLPLARVEELAAHYVREIREVQPEGPYLLGGYCFAGLVAYEIGCQLKEQGQEISMLALIDVYPKRPGRPGRLERERSRMRGFMASGAQGKAAWIRQRVVNLRSHLYFSTGRLAYDILAKRGRHKRLPRRLPWQIVRVASTWAQARHVARPANLTIDLFLPQRQPDWRPTPWDEIARGGVRLRPVVAPEIDHMSMMQEPHVRVLAEQMRRALQQAFDGATDDSDAAATSGAAVGDSPHGGSPHETANVS
jgi:amino acid adenylation domain-containing protein